MGFEKLDREFETYKGKHFKGSSKYPHHETIRENPTLTEQGGLAPPKL
jgi:hypothetical protein